MPSSMLSPIEYLRVYLPGSAVPNVLNVPLPYAVWSTGVPVKPMNTALGRPAWTVRFSVGVGMVIRFAVAPAGPPLNGVWD